MSALTRRRSDDPHRETWIIAYNGLVVGRIARCGGVPITAPQWAWSVGFYPGMEPGMHRSGVAENFDTARAKFESAWNALLPQLTDAAFEECRRSRAFHAWKDWMWASGYRLPTQNPSGRSQCCCGAAIDSDTMDRHVVTAHIGLTEDHFDHTGQVQRLVQDASR